MNGSTGSGNIGAGSPAWTPRVAIILGHLTFLNMIGRQCARMRFDVREKGFNRSLVKLGDV